VPAATGPCRPCRLLQGHPHLRSPFSAVERSAANAGVELAPFCRFRRNPLVSAPTPDANSQAGRRLRSCSACRVRLGLHARCPGLLEAGGPGGRFSPPTTRYAFPGAYGRRLTAARRAISRVMEPSAREAVYACRMEEARLASGPFWCLRPFVSQPLVCCRLLALLCKQAVWMKTKGHHSSMPKKRFASGGRPRRQGTSYCCLKQ